MAKLFLDGSKLFNHLDELNKLIKGERFAPVHVEISPTNACNYRCLFCYADYSGHINQTIPEEILLKLMRDMGHAGVKSCLFAGDGEPLLNKHVITAVRIGKEAGVDIALNSNGRLYNEESALQTLPYLTWIRFSVMAASPDVYGKLHGVNKNNFKKALDNIARAVEIKRKNNYEVTIGLQQVLLPENGHEVLELATIAKDIGVDYYVLKPFSLHGENDHYREGVSAVALRDKHKDILMKAQELSDDNFTSIIRWETFSDDGHRSYERCLGLPLIAQIASDGKIYTCCPFFGRPEFVYGDLHEKSFSDIWFGEHTHQLQNEIARDLDVHKECMTYCRHHQINKLLWELKTPPAHVNFI